jgi:hypothetical protein
MHITCKLTGKVGRGVKSHIIPRAFVDKNLDKHTRIQSGLGQKPKLLHTGWYDEKIVTREGEEILEKIDSLAATEIARHGLTWRHHPINCASKRHKFTDDGQELICFEEVNTSILRKFFLSVLWRAAVSKRSEFKDIIIDVMSLNKLRKIVRGDIEGSMSDFPCVLIINTTKGQPQNLAPLRQIIDVPPMNGFRGDKIKIFRFFLDGLVLHIGRKAMDIRLQGKWIPRLVGSSDKLYAIGIPYEISWQRDNLEQVIAETEYRWPNEIERLYGVA